jgi:hypothetical protein
MQVNSNICGSADLPLIVHSLLPVAYSLLPYRLSPVLDVKNITELLPSLMLLSIMAQMLQKLLTKELISEGVINGILCGQRFKALL